MTTITETEPDTGHDRDLSPTLWRILLRERRWPPRHPVRFVLHTHRWRRERDQRRGRRHDGRRLLRQGP